MTEAVPPSGAEGGVSLKEQGNEFFKSGNYLKAAALYTQAIKQDPSNPTLYRFSSILTDSFDLVLPFAIVMDGSVPLLVFLVAESSVFVAGLISIIPVFETQMGCCVYTRN